MQFNIIADVAGEYNTLMALLDKMPKNSLVYSLGDMCDRGPESLKVMKFFKKNQAVLGNHDHMLLSAIKGEFNDDIKYHKYYNNYGVWLNNGGFATLNNLTEHVINKNDLNDLLDEGKFKEISQIVMDKHSDLIEWLDKLPLFKVFDVKNQQNRSLIISHAAKLHTLSLEEAAKIESLHIEDTVIWNRGKIQELEGFVQVIGHNSHWGLKEFKNNKNQTYGYCLDASRSKVLIGMHWPSMQIFEQEYLE